MKKDKPTYNPENFPLTGLVRKPPILAFLQISNTKFYDAIKHGDIPKPIKLGGVSAWRAEDIRRVDGYEA